MSVNTIRKNDFNELLSTTKRTTDILESLIDNKLNLQVIKQEMKTGKKLGDVRGFPIIERETFLYSSNLDLIASHNYVIIYSNFIPIDMHKEINSKSRGIGEVIKLKDLISKREIIQCGYRSRAYLKDLYQNDVVTQFPPQYSTIPFKEYTITFQNFNEYGMKILEYFNPEIYESE